MPSTGEADTLRHRLLALVLRPTAPPLIAGVLTASGLIAAEVVLVHLLKRVAPENAFGAVFLLGVLVVSASWGFGLALATSLASALAYVWFHVSEGSGSLAPAVFVFLTVALLTNVLVGQARLRALEADQRRREADLSAELARIMLRAPDLPAALNTASTRTAEVLEIPYATLATDPAGAGEGEGHEVVALHDGTSPVGALLLPAALSSTQADRVRRLVPSLEALLSAAREREQINEAVSALAEQQAALRRVATLVARGADPADVYSVAVSELARGMPAEHVTLVRYLPESEHEAEVVAAADTEADRSFSPGERVSLLGDSVIIRIHATAAPARVDSYDLQMGPLAARLHATGLTAGVGAPVTVAGRLWGAIIVGSTRSTPLSPETEHRIGDFADLVATAILNADTRAELKASRARIVAAADQARRGFERDLHDGAQQRIVSAGLELGAIRAGFGARDAELDAQLAGVIDGLSGLYADLQELSRGIHPAILSRGGLGPAIKTLARRSSVPAYLDLDVTGELPDSVQVAAYYVVAEALTNTTKYAHASEVTVTAATRDGLLSLTVSDDGVGGAHADGGSGLVGLKDRVDALSGELVVTSPAGKGTTVTVTIPLAPML